MPGVAGSPGPSSCLEAPLLAHGASVLFSCVTPRDRCERREWGAGWGLWAWLCGGWRRTTGRVMGGRV